MDIVVHGTREAAFAIELGSLVSEMAAEVGLAGMNLTEREMVLLGAVAGFLARHLPPEPA